MHRLVLACAVMAVSACDRSGAPNGDTALRLADGPVGERCGHFLFVEDPGAFRRYDVRSSLGDGSLRAELLRIAVDGDRARAEWRLELSIGEEPALTSNSTVTCTPEGSEDWWEVLPSPLVTVADRTWRWPPALERGTRFEGTAALSMLDQHVDAEVSFEVERIEEIDVPAGRFRAARVTVRTTGSSGGSSEITEWVAPGVGMVRRTHPDGRGGEMTFELAELGP